jgi:hypothetical protein
MIRQARTAGFLFVLALCLAGVLPGPSVASSSSRAVGPQQSATATQSYGCLICHADKRQATGLGVHSDRGVLCHDCHGGDPTAFETAPAHGGDFKGALDKLESLSVCASCHGDPDEMRQYGLPADQIAELRTSRHGQLLLDDHNFDAPTCSDCHDPHATLRADDARSEVYPTNISETCAHCHEDESLMSPYGIPTGQVEAHRESAHGKALYEDQNFAAPTCIGCHGSHAALPPAVSQISNVCGRCHQNVRRAFDLGPHGRLEGRDAPLGCTSCHSNHHTERVPTDRVAETCAGCHEPGSAETTLGEEVQQVLLRAEGEMERAEEALHELARGGHEISDEQFLLRAAHTEFRTLETVQHTLNLEQMGDLERLITSASLDIRGKAEVSAEERWERKLFLLPVWFFGLGIVFLAGSRLRRLRLEAADEAGTS